MVTRRVEKENRNDVEKYVPYICLREQTFDRIERLEEKIVKNMLRSSTEVKLPAVEKIKKEKKSKKLCTKI